MLNKKKKCRGSNGGGYCPFPVLCRNTVVVSRQEGCSARGRCVCVHDQGPARVRACQGRPVVAYLLEFSVVTELAHIVSRQGVLGS